MSHDLIIRNGTVIDGTGTPGVQADVAISGDRIVEIGKITESAAEVIDAEGHVVTPGFIDGHTHMDAQVAWDPLGTCSCWHGVTSVVMGNCGFTLAPAKADQKHLVVRNLERAEDISGAAMEAGIDWTWETVPEYLDFVEAAPKGINYAAYVGHSALRTYAMGERAFSETATEADLAIMERELAAGLAAGAVGFSTSRSFNHETSDDRPVASRTATWEETARLVATVGEYNGLFEIANESAGRSRNLEKRANYFDRMTKLSVETGVPITFGVLALGDDESGWKPLLNLLDEAEAAGGKMIGQAHCREFSVLMSFKTRLPFDKLALWSEVRSESIERQRELIADPAVRQKLIDEANHGDYGSAIGTETRKPDYDWLYLMEQPVPPHRSVADIAAERGVDPVEVMLDAALATDMNQLFIQVIANRDQDVMRQIMEHPKTVMTFSDSGAHVSQIMDSSIHTHLLAHWVRATETFTLERAVQMITSEPAAAWGFGDRGVLRTGNAADIVVFDPKTVAPLMPTVEEDLPGGAKRLMQKASGFAATVVGGQVVLRNGEHTGALPGRLLRRT